MQVFQSTNSQNTFKLNGTTYPRNFMCNKLGTTNIGVYNAYDTKFQLLSSTHYSQVQVNGVVYTSQADLMAALASLLFAKQFNYVVQDMNATRLISVSGITVSGNYVTVQPAQWMINGNDCQTTSNTVLTVPYAATGKNRIDIIIGNAANQIQRIAGNETLGIALAPITPIDSVYITQMEINDNTIDTPPPAITGTLFVKKDEYSEHSVAASGTIALNLYDDSTAFRILEGSVDIVKGFDTNTYFINTAIYVGKEIKVVNDQSSPITLTHNSNAISIPMLFPDGNDLVLQPNEIAIFKLTKTTALFADFISINRVPTNTIPSLEQVTSVDNTSTSPLVVIDSADSNNFSELKKNQLILGHTSTGGGVGINADNTTEYYRLQAPNKLGGNDKTIATTEDLVTLTGGTYNAGTVTLTNSSGGTFSISGFSNHLTNTVYDSYLGTRLTPTNSGINGFGITKSVNGVVGLMAKNTDTTSNGAYASIAVGGDGTYYENGLGLNYFGKGYYIPYLRNSGAIFSNNNLNIINLNNSKIDFRTGNAFGSETSKLSISSGGTINIGVQPASGSTTTDKILVRTSTGDIKQVDYPTITADIDNYLPISGGTVTGATIFTNGLTGNTVSASTINSDLLFQQNDKGTSYLGYVGGGYNNFYYSSTDTSTDNWGTAMFNINPEEGVTFTTGNGNTNDQKSITMSNGTTDVFNLQNYRDSDGETNILTITPDITSSLKKIESNQGYTTSWGNGSLVMGTIYGSYPTQREILFTDNGDGNDFPSTMSTRFSVNVEEGFNFQTNDTDTNASTIMSSGNQIISFGVTNAVNSNQLNLFPDRLETNKKVISNGGYETPAGVTANTISATTYLNLPKGVVNGIASLDGGGKIPASQLPSSVMEYKGVFVPSAATFTDASGNAGDVWLASTGGTYNAGSGAITYAQGDWAVHNGTKFEKSLNSNTVVSVAGKTGVVTLNKTDVGLSNVDNTSDASKPVSTAQQTALDLKLNVTDLSNPFNAAYTLLGSSIKSVSLSVPTFSVIVTSAALTTQTMRFTAVYLEKDQTITGAKWYQAASGVYTANNYNGIGLYTYSAGTLTLVASTTNDGTIWQGTTNTWNSRPFSSTYNATKGVYYIGYLYCSSAQTTAPSIGAAATTTGGVMVDFANSAKINASLASQTTMPTTQASSSLALLTANAGFWLY